MMKLRHKSSKHEYSPTKYEPKSNKEGEFNNISIGTQNSLHVGLHSLTQNELFVQIKDTLKNSSLELTQFACDIINASKDLITKKQKFSKFSENMIKILVKYSSLLVYSTVATTTGVTCGIGACFSMALGCVIGSIASSKYNINKLCKEFKENNERELRLSALNMFNFNENDINNKNRFNKKEITKRYKVRSKECHPDREFGSQQDFILLNTYYGVLLGLLENNQNKINKNENKNIKCLEWKKDWNPTQTSEKNWMWDSINYYLQLG